MINLSGCSLADGAVEAISKVVKVRQLQSLAAVFAIQLCLLLAALLSSLLHLNQSHGGFIHALAHHVVCLIDLSDGK